MLGLRRRIGDLAKLACIRVKLEGGARSITPPNVNVEPGPFVESITPDQSESVCAGSPLLECQDSADKVFARDRTTAQIDGETS